MVAHDHHSPPDAEGHSRLPQVPRLHPGRATVRGGRSAALGRIRAMRRSGESERQHARAAEGRQRRGRATTGHSVAGRASAGLGAGGLVRLQRSGTETGGLLARKALYTHESPE